MIENSAPKPETERKPVRPAVHDPAQHRKVDTRRIKGVVVVTIRKRRAPAVDDVFGDGSAK